MCGGMGNDAIFSGPDYERLLDEDGNDLVGDGGGPDQGNCAAGADQLYRDEANDKLVGGAGTDRRDGGSGTDTAGPMRLGSAFPKTCGCFHHLALNDHNELAHAFSSAVWLLMRSMMISAPERCKD
jgi:hypothetical protein